MSILKRIVFSNFFLIKLYDVFKTNWIALKYYPKKKKIGESDNTIYIFSTPKYANLGDQAILQAEITYLKDRYPDYKINLIFQEDVYKYEAVKEPRSLFFVQGGGNFGTLYIDEEYRRNYILNEFQKVIIFPQTINYSSNISKINTFYLNKAKKTIAKTNALILVRDQLSYKFAKQHFKTNVELVPDIVLYMTSYFSNEKNRMSRNITLFLRNDGEKADFDITDITQYLNKSYELNFSDTHIGDLKKISNEEQRINLLENKWREFLESKFVITDRLHGMIFSYITKTPCIALNDKNSKVKNFYYTWFEDKTSIIFIENIADIKKINIEEFCDKASWEDEFKEIFINFKIGS